MRSKDKALAAHVKQVVAEVDAELCANGYPEDFSFLWLSKDVHDLPWLISAGFRPKKKQQSTFSDADECLIEDALEGLHTGIHKLPTPAMQLDYWVAHHVLDNWYSKSAVKRKLFQCCDKADRMSGTSAEAFVAGGAASASEHDSDEAPAGDLADVSDDEAVLA